VARKMIALVAMVLVTTMLAAPAGAQTASQRLEEVRQLLRDTSSPPDEDVANRIAALQRDFNEFASEYLLQDSRGGAVEPAETGGATRQANWRTRYLLVEADLTGLLGPADAPAATGGTPRLDAELRDRLQRIRTHLQTFYAATIQARDGNPVAHTGSAPNEQAPVAPTAAAPQIPPPVRMQPDAVEAGTSSASITSPTMSPRDAAAAPTVGIDPTTALMLIDRIQAILDQAAKDESPTSVAPVGTAGTPGDKESAAGGKVTIDRGLFDEIRAELNQIKALLKK
jgi:hypothetical protein